jgi:DUF1680 family protein
MSNMTRFLPFAQVHIDDPFWNERLRINREVSIPCQYRHNLEKGRINAFRLAWKPGQPNCPHIFWDSDVAKWVEAASYSYATHPKAEWKEKLEEVARLIASAQQPDGYLNTHYLVVDQDKRWSNLRDNHELYCAGHLMEAGVAHFEATSSRTLLDAVCRYADHIDSVFGPNPGQRRGYCGHEEIELALMRLHRVTGNDRYLALARYFVEERGRQPLYFDLESRARGEEPKPPHYASSVNGDYSYYQAHLPVREQTAPVGHAVRAVYLYSAMTDLARQLGDDTLLNACRTLWKNLSQRRMFLTGGIGTARQNEGFTRDYDLPNETAYCETCASVGLVFWSQRMLELDCDRRYADIMERALYNGVLSGVSLDGSKFFYENPLASAGRHHRQEWFECACCPSNLSRLLASLGSYIYSETDDGLAVHLYVGSQTEWTGAYKRRCKVTMTTRYPWEGKVALRIKGDAATEWTLRLRIPEWATSCRFKLNGKEIEPQIQNGYALIRRSWETGDGVELDLPLQPERVYADPRVAADVGRVALQRGPVVYCLEDVDQCRSVSEIALPRSARLSEKWEPDFLGGVVALEAEGLAPKNDQSTEPLYSPAKKMRTSPTRLKAVPYCAWDNRAPGSMAVWIPEEA